MGIGKVINVIAKLTILKGGLPEFTLMKYTVVDILNVMFVIMLIAFLAGTLPARKATRQNPVDAPRYE
jgi:putative ABC transport system permease protein